MVDIIFNEIRSWPGFLQSVMDYMQTATVIIPLLALLRSVCVCETSCILPPCSMCMAHVHWSGSSSELSIKFCY